MPFCHAERQIGVGLPYSGERRLKMVISVLEPGVPSTSPGNSSNPMILSYLQQRIYVGIIGVLLPFVLVLGNLMDGYGTQPSLSGYYYTPMRNVFIGALCGIAVFLAAYNGFDRADSVITNIAGLSALGVAFCPTTPGHPAVHQVVIGDLHLTFACVAFTLLAVMALRFGNSKPMPPKSELPLFADRLGYAFGFNRDAWEGTPPWAVITYRVCGFTILVCVALIYPGSLVYGYSLLILEWILLTAFGISWFVKGRKAVPAGRAAYHGARAQAIPAG
jgi:hypothetical protein